MIITGPTGVGIKYITQRDCTIIQYMSNNTVLNTPIVGNLYCHTGPTGYSVVDLNLNSCGDLITIYNDGQYIPSGKIVFYSTGFTGYTGPIGYTGATGITAIYLTGYTGLTGSTGSTGPQGYIATYGTTGYTGKTGPRGFTGSSGPNAITGSTGSTGAIGRLGYTGYKGYGNVTGPTGVYKLYTGTGIWGNVGSFTTYSDMINQLRQPYTFYPTWFCTKYIPFNAHDTSVILGKRYFVNNQLNSISIGGNQLSDINHMEASINIGNSTGTCFKNSINIGTNIGQSLYENSIDIGTTLTKNIYSEDNTSSIRIGYSNQKLYHNNNIILGNINQLSSDSYNIIIGSVNKVTCSSSYNIYITNNTEIYNIYNSCISIGNNIGSIYQPSDSIAIGSYAQVNNFNSSSYTNIAIGYYSGHSYQYTGCIAIGTHSGEFNQNSRGISIGTYAGNINQKSDSIAIGLYAGYNNQYSQSIAIGNYSGYNYQATGSICIGYESSNYQAGMHSINIGYNSGRYSSSYSINIGNNTARNSNGIHSVCIGNNAGYTGTGNFSVLLGNNAGINTIPDNYSFYTIKNLIGSIGGQLYYNYITGQIGRLVSSKKFKTNLVDLDFKTVNSIIKKLDIVEFNYKKSPNIKSIGLIADDVAKVCPELVFFDNENKPYSINYSLINVLILKQLQYICNSKSVFL